MREPPEYLRLSQTVPGNQTYSANRKCPMAINNSPNVAVPKANRTRTVDKTSSSVPPSASIAVASLLDMVLRKIKPASWTVPIAKGKLEKREKLSWWIKLLNITNLESAFLCGINTS